MILGIDEVGRGPWAGPLVVGAVVLGGEVINGLTDSKKISKKKRELLDTEIREKALGFGLGWVGANEIDEIGLSAALKLATIRAVEQVKTAYSEIIIDGTVNFLSKTKKGIYVTTLKKADLLIPSVSAASIIAKVARDNYMTNQDDIFPGYNFKSHVGYGTAAHRLAIDKLGVTPLHRLSFEPLRKYKNFTPEQTMSRSTDAMKSVGNIAEGLAAKYLLNLGHVIIDRNWKTRYCEIDIISKHHDVLYFSEVKYRSSEQQGIGLDVINTKKLNQMKFAVKLYVKSKNIVETDLRLAAISMSGKPPRVDIFLEI